MVFRNVSMVFFYVAVVFLHVAVVLLYVAASGVPPCFSGVSVCGGLWFLHHPLQHGVGQEEVARVALHLRSLLLPVGHRRPASQGTIINTSTSSAHHCDGGV